MQGREAGAAWISQLAEHDYDDFTLEQRLELVHLLVHAVMEGPSVRLCLEHRLEESQRIRKQMWEEAKVQLTSWNLISWGSITIQSPTC